MKVFFFVVALLVVGAVAFPKLNMTLDEKFASFKVNFNKVYKDTHEEQARAKIFSTNVGKLEALNANHSRPPFGITGFMDMNAAEFKDQMLNGYRKTKPSSKAEPPAHQRLASTQPKHSKEFGPKRFKGNTKLAGAKGENDIDVYSYCPSADCSPIQNQGVCGDCWAFAASEVLETQISLNSGTLTRLSPQEYADCLTRSCNTGGNVQYGWKFAQQYGTQTLANYPIVSTRSGNLGQCREQAVSTGQVNSYGNAGNNDAQTILNNLDGHGPIAIGVDANNWQFYDGGKYMGDPGCAPLAQNDCGTDIDHAVEIVGTYNATAAYVDGWVVRNHWGTQWGCGLGSDDGGYILLEINQDVCGSEEDTLMVNV